MEKRRKKAEKEEKTNILIKGPKPQRRDEIVIVGREN